MRSERARALAGVWLWTAMAAAALSGTARAIASETGPVIVIPGRPDVPVIINGRDVSWSVVEGDWGLARPGYIDPQVIYRLGPPLPIQPIVGGYFPKSGRAPRLDRDEHDTPRPPQRPQSYRRSWGIESQPTPVTIPPPYETPPVVVAPEFKHKP